MPLTLASFASFARLYFPARNGVRATHGIKGQVSCPPDCIAWVRNSEGAARPKSSGQPPRNHRRRISRRRRGPENHSPATPAFIGVIYRSYVPICLAPKITSFPVLLSDPVARSETSRRKQMPSNIQPLSPCTVRLFKTLYTMSEKANS